jgi:hypothetical protein
MRFTIDDKNRIADHYRRTADIEETAKWAAREWLETTGFEFLPYPVMIHISRRMVQNALEESVDEAHYL